MILLVTILVVIVALAGAIGWAVGRLARRRRRIGLGAFAVTAAPSVMLFLGYLEGMRGFEPEMAKMGHSALEAVGARLILEGVKDLAIIWGVVIGLMFIAGWATGAPRRRA
jgi:hypothetical protein